MSGLLDDLEPATVAAANPPTLPPAPKPPKSLLDDLEPVSLAPRAATGALESIQAGFQGSAPGLAWRGKLPDLVMDPQHASWWERALSGAAHVGSELPLMIGGAIAGAPAGAALGTAVAPGVGTAVGSLLGAGAGMGAVPAAIRQTLIEAYKSGDVMTAADFWNSVREVAKTTATEAGINAAAMGAGAVAGRVVGKAIAPAIGQSISVPTAIRTIEAADLATQIAAMPTIPAALQGRLPDAQEFVDAAILIGGLKAAHVASSNIVSVFVKTGKTPAEQVADVQKGRVDPQEFVGPPEKPVDPEVLKGLLKARLDAINTKLEGTPDKTVTGPDGKPITIPGQLKQFVSPEERAERDWLAANIDNADALAKRYSLKRPQQTEDEYVPPSRAEMLKVQENLFTETARLDEMAAKAEAAPLSDPERLEMNALKARVLDLENQLRAGAPELSRTPTYTADQFVEARKQADTRLAELTTKAETEALTDTERAERVFLSNSLDRPTALAKHFGFEPILTERPTPQAIDASAQRIHDDVLQQLKDADEARKAAGLEPLGDDHAQAVAALVRARVRTRAERLGVLPESLYAERPVKIEDVNKLQGEPGKFELSDEWQVVPDGTVLPSGTETRSSFVTGVTEARRMPGADSPIPQPSGSTGPELDLFGEPIQPPPMESQNQVATIEPAMVPVAGLTLSKDVPQFKAGANAKGVVEPLGGAWDPTGVGPIQIWQRLNGAMEVISGRHRLDKAQREGVDQIWAQVHKESEGFTRDMAAALDAMLNIRDGQGSVADYAQFFKAAGLTKDAADRAGLLARGKGKSGFAIARDASPDLLATHRAGNLSDEAALVISSTAPGSERLQALGIAAVQDGKTLLYASNLMRSVDMMAAERMMAGEQGDIFGFDDSALKEASAMAKKASSKQRAISEQIAAVSGASKRPELARKMGVNVEDPAAVQAKIIELKNEQYLWDNWPLYPELVKQLRGEVMKQEGVPNIIQRVLAEHGEIDSPNPEDARTRVSVETAERLAKENHPDAGIAALLAYVSDDFTKLSQDVKMKNPATRALVELIKDLPPSPSGDLYRVLAFPTERARTQFLRKVNAGAATALQSERPVMSFTQDNPEGAGAFQNVGRDVASQFGEHTVVIQITPAIGRQLNIGRDISYLYNGTMGEGAGVEYLIPRDTQFKLRSAEQRNGEPWITLEPTSRQRETTLFQEPSDIVDKPETPAEAASRDQVAADAAARTTSAEVTRTTINAIRASAAVMDANSFLDKYVGELLPEHLEHKIYPARQIHGTLDPRLLDPSEAEEWAEIEINPDTQSSYAAGKQQGQILIRGTPDDLRFRQQVVDGHHRVAAAIAAGANVDVIYDLQTLAEIWKRENGSPQRIREIKADYQKHLNQTRNTLFQDIHDRWYRSALGEAIQNANMKAAPAKGWQDFLKGQVAKGGVKADEIKWSGVEDWLKLQEGKVTKEQVADYLASNGVKVEETQLGGYGNRTPRDQAVAGDVEMLKAAGWKVDTNPDDPGRYMFIDPDTQDFISAGEIRQFAEEQTIPGPNGTMMPNTEFAPIPQAVVDAAERVERYLNAGTEGVRATKFGTYQLPGGENYRELLLTLPKREGVVDNKAIAALTTEWNAWREARNIPPVTADAIPRATWDRLTEDEQRYTYDFRDRWDSANEAAKREAGVFQSSHFDQPNILAHIRFNERTDAEGKKVLFVEEIQSDWAQKGKKARNEMVSELAKSKGISKEEAAKLLPPGAGFEDKAAVAAFRQQMADKYGDDYPRQMTQEEKDQYYAMREGPPTAPFVGKTDAWVSLALKRVIRYAAENGFDKVAWTRGEQQVERYSSALRKAVDVIEWKKTPEGVQIVGYKGGEKRIPHDVTLDVMLRDQGMKWSHINDLPQSEMPEGGWPAPWQVTFRDGSSVYYDSMGDAKKLIESEWRKDHNLEAENRRKVVDTTEKEDSLSDSIGKAMADQIRNDPNQTGTIEGDQITVSDTGMAGFYDKIVPKVAKEVLKKLGGGKVDEVNIGEGQKHDLYVVKTNPTTWQVKDEITGRWLGHSAEQWVESPVEGKEFRSESEATQASSKIQDMPTKLPQLGFEITPAMRESAMAGQPLFQKQTDQLHRGSYDIAKNLVTTLQGADKSTVVHELTHSWLEEMKADAARPDAPASIKADWEIIRRELAIPETGEISRASHEQFARTGERYLAEGEAPSRELQSVFARFREWLLDIYKSVMNLNVEINPELRQVLDRMLATDEEIAAARDLGVPRAYVPEAAAAAKDAIVPPPQARPARRQITPGFEAEQASMQPYADELPPGPGEAPDNIHVNYAYINTPTDVKLAMQRMAEIDQANIQRQRGGTEGVKSWAEANAEQAKYLNDILGGGPDTLHLFEPRDPDAPHVDVRLGILKKLAVGAAKDSARLRDVVLQAGHDATVRQQLEYMGSIERARMIQAEFLGERASVARALNALKDVTEGTGEIGRMLEAIGLGDEGKLFQAGRTPAEEQAYLKAKLDEILQNYKGKSVLDIAKLHKEIGTLKGTFKLAKEVSQATRWEQIVEGWRAGLLSGPVTHTTNLLGTEAFHVMRPAVDALATIIGMARGASPGMGESDRASMSEAVARLTGMLGGVQDGIKVAIAEFKADEATGKTEAYRTAIPGQIGRIIRTPLRLMGAEDALVTTMYTRGEIRTLAIRQAFDEDLNPSTREFAERVSYLQDNPTPEMQVAAETAATRMTFNAPLGEKGVALQGFVNKWNLQWMIPFIRTPINIAKELLRMSPFAPVIGEWRQAFAKGGVERDRALAEMALGSGIMAITMAYAFAGNVSGAGSPDPGKNRGKAGVWQPYSILIGDTWYEYARIQPTGTLMGMAADMAAIWDHMTDEEKDKVPRMLSAAFAQAITNQTFLQGIANFVNALSDPTRFGPRFLQSMAGSMVPNIIGQPTTMADPVVREVNSALEAIQARIPGMRQDLLPKRDWLGEPVQTKERLGVVMPVREQQISDDKVRQEAARLDISMAAAPKKTHIGKGTGKLGDVKLTPEEQDAFEKIGGEFAHGILQNIVNAPGYDQMPDMVKRKIFGNVLTAAHRVAAVQALPMEKRIAYLQEITEKVQQELTPGDAP